MIFARYDERTSRTISCVIAHVIHLQENVLIGNDGQPRISSYGRARVMDLVSDTDNYFYSRERWLAPELKEGIYNLRCRNTKTDVFAFACLCIEVRPFFSWIYSS